MRIRQPYGHTPLIQLSEALVPGAARVWAKDESRNPTASVKARAAAAMLQAAIEAGRIRADSVVVEPTSGNTGVGLAFVCASLGLKLKLTMPESMSIERRKLLAHLGAELVLTPAAGGMKGAIEAAEKILAEDPKAFLPDQFSNPANPQVHRETTAEEIWADRDGAVDILIAGVGTGGTLTGAGGRLRELNPDLQIIAVEPSESPVISGGAPGPHKIQGIGAGFIPKNLDVTLIDETVQVSSEDALSAARDAARLDGLLNGISSGAAIVAARKIAAENEAAGKDIVVILPDTAERYLSTPLFAGE